MSALQRSPKPISRFDQRAQISRLHNRVAGVRRDAEFGFRPGAMQVPRARHRTHNVISTLDYDTRNVPNLSNVLKQIIVSRKETVVHEVVTLDAREGLGE